MAIIRYAHSSSWFPTFVSILLSFTLLHEALGFNMIVKNHYVPVRQTNPSILLAKAKAKTKAKGKETKSKLTSERRRQLGIADDEDEYDLDRALESNTDPLISKLIAGSLIVVLLGLLILGVVIPSFTDYGEGVCNPILTAGRC
jgi:hypothetical protein